MDLSINLEDYKLNIRAAVIIIHNNKVLVHKNITESHYALLGGRVRIGEDTAQTVKREVLEETGKQIEITAYISTIENFFESNNMKYHEILFVHKAEFVNEDDKKLLETIKNKEGRNELQYEWLDLDKIDKYKILPEVIKPVLKNGKFPVHIINKELK